LDIFRGFALTGGQAFPFCLPFKQKILRSWAADSGMKRQRRASPPLDLFENY